MSPFSRRLALLTLLASLALGSISQADDREAQLDGLRMMTFNIRYNNPRDGANAWPNRREMVADVVKDYKADIVGMQEALGSQIRDLERLLPEYAWYGVGRDDGKTRGEYSPIFYRRDRLELLEKKTFWLSEHPEKVGSRSWDAAITRIATQVLFRDRTTKRTFRVINTHFDHRGVEAREQSAKLIASRVAKLQADSKTSNPTVVMGDFNCLPDSDPFKAMTSTKSALHDSRSLAKQPKGPNSTWCGFRAVVPNRRIDFLFVNDAWSVQAHVTIARTKNDRFPSDHLPVLIDVGFKTSTGDSK